METLGFGMPEENPLSCPGKKKKDYEIFGPGTYFQKSLAQ